MALTEEQVEALDELEAATNAYADRSLERIERRSRLLKRLNTRLDDFQTPLEDQQTLQVLARIRSLGV